MMYHLFLFILLSYLIGAIPTAYIAARIRIGKDIRREGSGNMGATNALIVIGPLIGITVYTIDLFKGLVPVLIARHYIGSDISMAACGLAAIIGHDFPVYVGFEGGKGIATTTGVIFGLNSMVMWAIMPCWAILALITDKFILSSLICVLLVPLLMFVFKISTVFTLFGVAYLLLALFTHRRDIVRILEGKEKGARESVLKYFGR